MFNLIIGIVVGYFLKPYIDRWIESYKSKKGL